jgi:hypothetical protein
MRSCSRPIFAAQIVDWEMPELPELRLAAQYISRVCKSLVFKAPLQKSAISKNDQVQTPFQRFTVSSQSRGKEMLLLLADATQKSSALTQTNTAKISDHADPFKVVFRFGMRYDSVEHFHYQFF